MRYILALCATVLALLAPAQSQATAIKSEYSGKCLTYGANPTQAACKADLASQDFDIVGGTWLAGSATMVYRIRAGTKCLTASSAQPTANAIWADCAADTFDGYNANKGQFWVLYKNGSYTEWQSQLSADNNPMCLAIKGNSQADGAFYEMRACSEGGGDIFSEIDQTKTWTLALPICSKGTNVPGCSSSTKLGRGVAPGDVVAKGQACDCTEQFGNYCTLKSRSTHAAQCKTASSTSITFLKRLEFQTRPVVASTGVPSKDAFRLATASGPITATKNMVIKGKRISNPNGACITVPPGVTGVRIQENEIGPCGTSSSVLDGSPGVDIQGSDVVMERNVVHDVAAGFYATSSAKAPITVDRNRVYNTYTKRRGNWIRGQFAQFNSVTGGAGGSIKVTCNVSDITDDTTTRDFDDHINMFASSGTQNNPIEIAYNRIRGGVSASGSAIVVGDFGGQWLNVHDNVVVLSSNTGIAVAGGSNITIQNNRVWNRGATAASKTSGAFGAVNFEGASKPTSNILFKDNRGVANGWLYGGTGQLSTGFYTPTSAATNGDWPDLKVDGLTLTNNLWQDTTLTQGIIDTSFAQCNTATLTAAVTDPVDNGNGGGGGGSDTGNQTSTASVSIQDNLTGAAFLDGKNNGYSKLISGQYYVINDIWAWDNYSQYPVFTKDRTKYQQTGISTLQADGSVSARVKWYYPYYPGEVAPWCDKNGQPAGCKYDQLEVMGYPAAVYGHIQSTEPVGGAKLPLKVSQLTRVKSTTAGVVKNGQQQGMFHISYDNWINDDARMGSDGIRNNRRVEIMMPIMANAGYGIPNTPAAATAGRDCSAGGPTGGCAGRGQDYVMTTTIDGTTYDVFYRYGKALQPNGSYRMGGLAWDFIVFIPKVLPTNKPHTVDWLKIVNMLKSPLPGMSRALIQSNDWYLGNISIGGEPIHNRNKNIPAQADVTIGGFKVEVN